jgi:oxygen-dependent protoporphyrinogen oxidase
MPGAPVVIVGGGVSGLAAAYELARRHVPFLLLEAAPTLGGVVKTERVDGFLIDAGPDALLTQKPAAIELCGELGIGHRLRPQAARGTFLVRGGALRAMPEASVFGIPVDWAPFVTTRAFSLRGKLRMAAEYLLPGRPPEGDESIASFMGRRFGREAVEYLADPLLAGIHGGDAERLSMQALFPRFLEMERKYGSVIRGFRAGARQRAGTGPAPAPFVAPIGGLRELTDALALALPPGSVRTGVRVDGIEALAPHRFRLHLDEGTTITAEAVLLATPPRVTAPIVRALDPTLAGACARIPSVSVVTTALAYPRHAVRHRLDGTGLVVSKSEGMSISALTWVSSKWECRAPEGQVLLRAYLGGARDPGAIDLPTDAIVARAHRDVARLLGVTGDPVLARVYRWPHVNAQQEVGHLGLMAQIEDRLAAHAGLFISAAGFRGSGIADCVADGRRQAIAAAAAVPELLTA